MKCDDDDDEMSPGSPPSYPSTSDNPAMKYNDMNGAYCLDVSALMVGKLVRRATHIVHVAFSDRNTIKQSIHLFL